MIKSSLKGFFAAFVFTMLAGLQTAPAQELYPIGFCAGSNRGAFVGIAVINHCVSWEARSQAESKARSFADGFAKNGCQRTSVGCAAVCAAAGSTPLAGNAARGVSFTQARQAEKGFPADNVQLLSQNLGVCARTRLRDSSVSGGSGAKTCSPPPPGVPASAWPWSYPPNVGRATADSFCGCVCR